MALDDKIFQSAIARINKVKTRQPSVSQVLVFEDPPHLIHSSLRKNTIIENFAGDPEIPSSLPVEKLEEITFVKGTERDTNKGTKKGTQNIDTQKEGTFKDTNNSTDKDTEKGTTELKNYTGNSFINDIFDTSYLYQRPYDALTGISKKIVDTIFEICRKTKQEETPPIPFATLVRLCNEKKNSIKVTRKRLLDEGIIITKKAPHVASKGRSGMLVYRIREDLFNEIDDSLSLLVRKENITDKWGTKNGTNKGTPSSSSSSYLNKTTTTDLPEEWRNINFNELEIINFGIIELKNIYKKAFDKISPEQVQESINHFAWGLKNNSDRYKSMNAKSGMLVKTLSDGDLWKESGYQSQVEIDRIEKDKKLTASIEKRFQEAKFLEWFDSLPTNQKGSYVPEVVKKETAWLNSQSIMEKEHAKKYFSKIVWPEILCELKQELSNEFI